MSILGKYKWEVTHATLLVGVITILTLVTHLTGTPLQTHFPEKPTAFAAYPRPPSFDMGQPGLSARPIHVSSKPRLTQPKPSNPREVVVGPSGINSRYTLLRTDRKSVSPTLDELTVKLHVASLAMENLVSPWESDMLELRSQGQEPINPKTPFRMPIPSGDSRDQEIVFSIPSTLKLDHTRLAIHYFNYSKEIPLNLPPDRTE